MQLTPIGAIADVLWHEIKNHTTNMELDAYIVMPNHIHGILILTGAESTAVQTLHATPPILAATGSGAVQTLHATPPILAATEMGAVQTLHATPPILAATEIGAVQTLHATSLLQSPPKTPNQLMSKISPPRDSISTIIRSYKSAVTKHAHRLGFDFEWQPRFYDHVIRDEKSFHNIRNYIIRNPEKWPGDKFYVK